MMVIIEFSLLKIQINICNNSAVNKESPCKDRGKKTTTHLACNLQPVI